MRSLFFWRRKRLVEATNEFAVQPVPASAPTAPAPAPLASAPPATASASITPLTLNTPAMSLVYASALQDDRILQPHDNASPARVAQLLAASQALAPIGSEPRYTPHQPSLLPQLLETLNDEDASLRALSRIVAQDPELTGNLLRTANSALYRISSTPIESVERATAMLGTTGIRTLLTAALLQPLAQSRPGEAGHFGELIWEHALYSASAAEAWAARNQGTDPFTAHLLALLHGLGCVAVYRALIDLFAAQPDWQSDQTLMATTLETNAAVTAARIAAHWGLSERTQQALESQSSAAPVGDHSPLSQALHFGLLIGAMTLLCKEGKLTANAALEQIHARGFADAQTDRIWDRLLRAYVRPQA